MYEEMILRSQLPHHEIPILSVGEYIMDRLQKLEDKTCIIEAKTGEKLSVKQLITKANSIAVALLKRGVTKSDIILCFSTNNLEYAILLFAIYFMGNTFTSVKPYDNVFELRNQIQNSGSTLIFTSLSNAHIVHKVLNDDNIAKQIKLVTVFNGTYDTFISFNDLLSEGNNEKLDKIPYFEIKPKEDIFTIVYTSGTTGLPKGAILTHFAFVASMEIFDVFFGLKSKETVKIAAFYPFGHSSGNILSPTWISGGHTIVIYDGIDEEMILQSVETYRISFLPLFPAFGHRLLDVDIKDKYDLSSVKLMTGAGSKFSINVAKRLIERYNVAFYEGYAISEFSFPVNISDYEVGSIGTVAPDTELKIIDLNTGRSLGPNIDGEICLRGPQIFSGYLNNESETKASIDSQGWFHTGDIGHYDEGQRLFITDRLKELIKFKAWSVSPVEIESLLMTHESVEAVAVVGVKHITDGQLPRAYVKKCSKVTEEELIKFVEENMGFQKRLRGGVRFVDKVPQTITRKVDRKYFKNLVSNEIIG